MNSRNARRIMGAMIVVSLLGLRAIEAAGPILRYGSAFLKFGNEKQRSGDDPDAIRFYLRAIAADPLLAEGYQKAGEWYNHRGEDALALQYLQRATYLNPNLGQAHDDIATIHRRAGRYRYALYALQRAIGTSHYNPSPVYRYHKGLTHLLAGEVQSALYEAQEAEDLGGVALAEDLRTQAVEKYFAR